MADPLQQDDARGEELISGAKDREATRQAAASGQAPATDSGSKQGALATGIGSAAAASGVGRVAQVAGILSGNKKKAGIGGLIISLVIGGVFASPWLMAMKYLDFAENLYSHHFKRVNHSFQVRETRVLKYALKSFDPTFNPESSIVNYDQSPLKNLYSKIRDKDLLQKLSTDGYKFELKSSGSRQYLTIHDPNRNVDFNTIDSANFDRQFDLSMSRAEARVHVSRVASELTHGEGWFKRWSVKRRLTRITGTKWHWMDPWKQKKSALTNSVRNATVGFIIEHGLTDKFTTRLVEIIAGGEADNQLAQTFQAKQKAAEKAGELLTAELNQKLLTSALSETIAKVVSGPAGWIVLGVTVGCKVNDLAENGYAELKKLASDKAKTEDMITFTQIISSESQLKEGKTDGDVVNATMLTLTDSAGRDFSTSNNFKRTYTSVPYAKGASCSNDVELCPNQQPDNIIDTTLIGQGLKQSAEFTSGGVSKYFLSLIGGPGSYTYDFICATVGKALSMIGTWFANILNWIFDKVATQAMKDLITQLAGFITTNLALPAINQLLPPVVNANTVGPAKANSAAVGAISASSAIMADYGAPIVSQAQVDQLALSSAADDAVIQKNQSSFTRLASLDNPLSLASRFIMSVPSTPKAAMMSIVTFPFKVASLNWSRLASYFSNNFGQSANAGIPNNDAQSLGVEINAFPEDKLQNEPLNSPLMAKFDTSVACSMLGGLSTDPLPASCTPEDGGADASAATPATPTTGSTAPLACPATPCNEQTLAQQILANPNITFDLGPNGHIAAPFKDLASGTNARTDNAAGTTDVNPKLLSYLLHLGQSHKIQISSLTTDHPGDNVIMHSMCHSCGGAVDIDYFDGQALYGTNAASDSFINTAVPFVPANNGPTFGDGDGHTLPSMLAAGLSAFPDKFNHVHTQIAW